MSEKDDLEKAHRDRQFAFLQMKIKEMHAVAAAQTVLLDSLYRHAFSGRPEDFEDMVDGLLETLSDAKKLDPAKSEDVIDQQAHITLWMQRFRARVSALIRKR